MRQQPTLYKASFGYLLKHPWQLGLALLGIAIGVAVMVAVDLANSSSRKAFLLSMDTLNGQATHQILGGPEGVDESLYARLRSMHGVRSIAPIVEGRAAIDGRYLNVLGVDVFAEREFRSYTLPVAEERSVVGAESAFTTIREFLIVPGAVMLAADTAATLGLDVGADIEVVASGRRHAARLIGTLRAADQQPGNLLIVDIATAQEWLGRTGYLSRIDVRLADPDNDAQALEALLPPGVRLLDAAGRTQTTAEMTSAFMTNLTAMSLLALLVGIFLIYNSVSFAVLQRRGLIGVLRALGLTRRQAFGLIVGEAAVLGIVGSLLGVAAGIWLGEELLALVSRSINDLYFRLSVTDVAISGWSVSKGLLAGIGATLVAATVPAWEAAGYQPGLSLRRSVVERRVGRLAPLLLGLGIAGILAALAILELSGDSLFAGLIALFALILGSALCIPVLVRAITRACSPIVARLGGTSARLAIDGIGASLSRTGVAIVALAVAVSATVGVSVMVDSFRVAVSQWLGNTLQSDIYAGVPAGSLDPELVRDIVALEDVRAHSTSRRAWLESAQGRTRVIALQMAPQSYAGTELLGVDKDVAWRRFDDGAVVVSQPYAYRNAVAAGDRISLPTGRGARDFEVAATYRSYDADQGAVVMSRATYDAHWDDEGVDSIGLYLAAGVDDDAFMQRMRELSAGRQDIRMSSNREIRDLSLAIFDRTFVITDVLYWLAVGVAIIGILGAMLALQLERARELAVLRALGMTPGQLGGMVTLQSGLIGLLSGLAAVPLGLVMAWVLIDVINRRSFGWQMAVSIDPAIPGSALSLAIGAALVAGLYPAWRAASSRPAAAMREE